MTRGEPPETEMGWGPGNGVAEGGLATILEWWKQNRLCKLVNFKWPWYKDSDSLKQLCWHLFLESLLNAEACQIETMVLQYIVKKREDASRNSQSSCLREFGTEPLNELIEKRLNCANFFKQMKEEKLDKNYLHFTYLFLFTE